MGEELMEQLIELLEDLLEVHYGEEPGNLFGEDLVNRTKEMIERLKE